MTEEMGRASLPPKPPKPPPSLSQIHKHTFGGAAIVRVISLSNPFAHRTQKSAITHSVSMLSAMDKIISVCSLFFFQWCFALTKGRASEGAKETDRLSADIHYVMNGGGGGS